MSLALKGTGLFRDGTRSAPAAETARSQGMAACDRQSGCAWLLDSWKETP